MNYARIVIVTLLALLLWAGVVVTGALFVWWRQPVAPTGDARAFMRRQRRTPRVIGSLGPGLARDPRRLWRVPRPGASCEGCER